jgi:transposase-like protein
MSPMVKSLGTRIGEHQRKFFAAGGKAKAIKYPEEWREEAARLQSELKIPVADLARELGVGHSAMKRWCRKSVGMRPRKVPKPAKAGFVPVEVVAGNGHVPDRSARTAAAQVTLREITVDIAPDAGDDAVAAVIAMLARGGRLGPC